MHGGHRPRRSIDGVFTHIGTHSTSMKTSMGYGSKAAGGHSWPPNEKFA